MCFLLARVDRKDALLIFIVFLLFFLTLHRIMICIITAVSIKGILQASNIGGNSINNPKNFMRKKKNQQIDAIK